MTDCKTCKTAILSSNQGTVIVQITAPWSNTNNCYILSLSIFVRDSTALTIELSVTMV